MPSQEFCNSHSSFLNSFAIRLNASESELFGGIVLLGNLNGAVASLYTKLSRALRKASCYSFFVYMPVQSDLVRRCFEQVVTPVRRLGWWIELDYRPNERVLICATHFVLGTRLFAEESSRIQDSLAALRHWVQECAYFLYQQSQEEAERRLAAFLASRAR